MQKFGFLKRKPCAWYLLGVFLLLLLGLTACKKEETHSVPYGYADAELYTPCSEFHYAANGLRQVVISWQSGNIQLKAGTSSTFTVRESSPSLPEEQKMHYLQENGTLYIRFCASGYAGTIPCAEKFLTVELPKNVSLHLETLSADCTGNGLSLDTLEGRSISGGLHFDALHAKNVSLETVSGNIILSGKNSFEDLSMTSISGNMEVAYESCRVLSAFSDSGNVTLQTPPEGIALTFSTVNGRLQSSFPYRETEGILYFGDGKTELRAEKTVSTVSGDLTMIKGPTSSDSTEEDGA